MRRERGAGDDPPLAAILVLAFATPHGGQDPAGAHPEGQAVVVGETITIRSEILGEDWRVHVPLPSDYDVEPDAHYPVIYQLDGEAPDAFTYVAGWSNPVPTYAG